MEKQLLNLTIFIQPLSLIENLSSPSTQPLLMSPKRLILKVPKCFKCQEFCHVTSNCANRTTITIVEEVREISSEEDKEPIFDEE